LTERPFLSRCGARVGSGRALRYSMCRLTWSRERWFLFDRRRRMIVGMRRPARLGRDGVPAPSGCLVVILVALLRTPNLIPDRQDGVHALSRYPVCSHHDLLYSAGASHGHKSLQRFLDLRRGRVAQEARRRWCWRCRWCVPAGSPDNGANRWWPARSGTDRRLCRLDAVVDLLHIERRHPLHQLAPGEPGLALLVSCAGDHEQLPGRAELEEQGLLQRHRALLGGQIVLQPLQDRAAVGDVLACPVSSAETVGGDQDTAESSEAQPREPGHHGGG